MTLFNKTPRSTVLSISQSEDIGDSCYFFFLFVFADQMSLVSSTFSLWVDAPARVLFI